MRTFKRSLSVLLSIIMVLSLFTVIPVNAAETDDDSAAGAVTNFNIVVGKTPVTSDNYLNILGDGTARYYPDSNKLIINKPTLTEAKYPEDGLIYINRKDNVTITGSFHMTSAITDIGIGSVGALTFVGDFTFYGRKSGVVANHSVFVDDGNLTAIGTNKSNSLGISIGEGGKLVVERSARRLRAKGDGVAIRADDMIMQNRRITSPQGAFFSGYYKSVLVEDFSDVAYDITAEPTNIIDYNVWVGYRRVTSANKDDVYGDGKESYDPETKTLTLNDPTIPAAIPRR